MEQKHKNMLIGGLLAIVLIMAVGYAAFATQLTINGTANITSNWDVHIKDITAGDPTGTAENIADSTKVDPENSLEATFGTKLVSPGDSITYTVTVENSGTLDAEVASINVTQKNTGMVEEAPADEDVNVTGPNEGNGNYKTSDDASNPIVYSVTGIKVGDVIGKSAGEEGTSTTFQITVTYNPEITSQPTEAQMASTLKIQLSYVQHTDSP